MIRFLLSVLSLKHLRKWIGRHKKPEQNITWTFRNVGAKSELKTEIILENEVLIYEKGRRKFCAVRCPKCHSHNIELNLVKNPNFQHWMISGPKNFTIHPSINYKTDECSAHYWIRNGKIYWAGDGDL